MESVETQSSESGMDHPGSHGQESVSSLFQPDALVADQYFNNFRSNAQLEPEKRLMLAVLEDAVACFQRYILARDSKGKKLFVEAQEWIMEGESGRIFSFDSVCEVLGFNPEYLRQGLMRWKRQKLGKRAGTEVWEGREMVDISREVRFP